MLVRASVAALFLAAATCTSFTVGDSPPIRVAPPSEENERACYEACLDRAARTNTDSGHCAKRCYP